MEEDTSKWFPRSNSAREVRDRLVAFALYKGVDLQYNQRITRLQRESSSGMWYCESEGGEQYRAPRVVVAMGGKSFPAVGTDGKGYQLAQELGHTIRPVYPALTPLTGPHPGGNQLAGVSLNVGVTAEAGPSGQLRTDAHRTGFLFTHRGYSGPSILDLSHYAVIDIEGLREAADGTRTTAITVNWCDMSEESWRGLFLSALAKGGSATRLVSNMLGERMPHRLALALCEEAGVAHQRMADLTKDKREQLIGLLTQYRLPYTGHQGYKKAEVTGGGVSLEEVKWETLESGIEANRGLFFCGEVLDCFGRIGGFNFYWAWVTGRLAGMSAASARLSSPSS